jgi:hypothetical protein
MKKALKLSLTLLIILLISSCGSVKYKDITGETTIKEVFNPDKYLDTDNIYYAIVSGEHGDENTAKIIALENAQREFLNKAEAMVNSAAKIEESGSLRNRVGTLDRDAKIGVITKAVGKNIQRVDSQLSYREISEGKSTYIYRAVYKIEVDNIISLLTEL